MSESDTDKIQDETAESYMELREAESEDGEYLEARGELVHAIACLEAH